MAVSATNAPLSGLSRRLVQDGLIAEDAVIHAIKGAEAQHIGLVAYLVDRQLVSAAKIAVAASSEFGVPLLDLDALDLDMEAVKSVDQRLLAKHRVLPLLLRGKRLFLGVSDPTAHAAIEFYAEVFEQLGALDALEGFAAHFGADFYRLPRNTDSITLRQQEWQVPEQLPLGRDFLTPLRAGENLSWRVLDRGI